MQGSSTVRLVLTVDPAPSSGPIRAPPHRMMAAERTQSPAAMPRFDILAWRQGHDWPAGLPDGSSSYVAARVNHGR